MVRPRLKHCNRIGPLGVVGLVWYESRMPASRTLIAVLLCCAAARAEELQPVIARPVTLPQGKLELTLHGTYTNWGSNQSAGGGYYSMSGETLALGADFGATDKVQLGLGLALPINPGTGFGSILGTAAFAVDNGIALRTDVGVERIGVNGDTTFFISTTVTRYFAGVGASVKVPISPTMAFVTGRTGAIHFGHFNNIGQNGTGFYAGASALTEASSDFLVLSGGNNGGSTIVGINLPAGLLLQADPHLAVTLQAGYSAVIQRINPGTTQALHFIPLGLEAVVSPTPLMDIGARFFLDGYVAQSGGSSSGGPRYFDMRALMLWFRIHA